MSRNRRHVRVPPDLTSLFDVLFIVIFAALIRAAAVEQAAAKPPEPKPQLPPVKLESKALRTQALSQLDEQLAARPIVVVRIAAATGTLSAIELGDNVTKLDTPLLEHDPDPDIGLAYLGERSADQRICRQLMLQLRATDLAAYLVIIAPDKHLSDLPHALYDGLRHDADRCLDQKGLAVLVDPTATESSGSQTPSSGSPTPSSGSPTPSSGVPTPSSGSPTPSSGAPTEPAPAGSSRDSEEEAR